MLKIKLVKSKIGLKLAIVGVLCAGLIANLVAPPAQAMGLQLDKKVTKKQTTAASSITAPTFSTATGSQLFLAFVAVDGPGGTGVQTVSSVTGGGLTWTLRKRANAPGSGSSEIWQAVATSAKSNVAVKATMSKTGYVGQLTVATFTGANLSQNGAVAGASAVNGAATVSLATTRQNSWVWAVGNDWDRAVARTLGANQTKVDETVNTVIGDTQWVQRQNNVTPAAGTTIITNTTAPTNDRWNMVAIEIPNAVADSIPPAAPVIANPVNNASGNDATPTFSGTGEAGATVNLVIDATTPVTTVVDGAGNWTYTPSVSLGDGSHTVRATQADAAGNISPESNVINFTIDATAPSVTVNQKEGQADPTPVNSATFTVVFSEAIDAGSFTANDLTVAGTTGVVASFSQLNATTWEVAVTGMTRGDTAVVNLGASSVTDAMGNGNQASTSTDNAVKFDDSIVAAPVIAVPGNNARTNNSQPVIAGTGVDGMMITVRVDNGVSACAEGAVTVTAGVWQCTPTASLVDGFHVIEATQTDAENNESLASNPVSITVDTVKPTVTVNQKEGQPDPTTINSAAYTIVFSEEVDSSSFAREDLTVSGGTGSVTTFTQINATTWEVVVTGMTSGDITSVTVGTNKLSDLAGNENQASTSTDNSVLFQAPTTLKGWEVTAANTGLAAHGMSCSQNLPEYTGPSRVPAGTVISGMKVTKPLILAQGGVIIEKSCLQPTYSDQTIVQTWDPNADCSGSDGCPPPAGLSIIRDSEFDGSKLTLSDRIYTTAFKGIATLQRNYVHNVGSGIGIIAAGKQLDLLVEQNYVVGLVSFGTGETHTDAFTIRDLDGSQKPDRVGIVRNNRFDCDGGDESGALFLQAWGRINNVTVEGNLMEGGGYQLTLETKDNGTYGNIKAFDNRFSGTGWGAVNTQSGHAGWAAWQNNYYNNPSAPNNQGAVVNP